MLKKDKGSTLLAVLIFAFVLMVIVSALAYNFRMDSLSIDSLVREKQNSNVSEGYFGDIVGSTDLTIDNEEDIGNFKFVTEPNSISPGFEYENTNAELYNADAFLISHRIVHNFFDDGVLRNIRNFIYNTLPKSTMTRYDDSIIPLNVPFVNIDAISGSLADQRLNVDGVILDGERGYIGYIDTRNISDSDNGHGNDDDHNDDGNPGNGGNNGAIVFSFNLVVGGNSTRVFLPADITAGYRISVGWDLNAGSWNIFLAVYDGNMVYTSSTTLRNLIDNINQANVDLSDWQLVANLPGGATYYPRYSPGTDYLVGDIVNSGGDLYRCKNASLCSSDHPANLAAYTPGTGTAWGTVWDYVELGTTSGEGDGSSGDYSTYSPGTEYTVGQTVEKDGSLYSCKVESWCSSDNTTMLAAYAPGTGSAWGLAWDFIGTVDEDGGGSEDGDGTGSAISETDTTILVKWYYDMVREVPKPLILRKMQRSANYDLDIYRATYNATTRVFTAILADSFTTGTTNYDQNQVYMVIPDGLFVLDVGMPLIFQGKNIFDFSVEGSYVIGDGSNSTKAVLVKEPIDTPVIIKRNSTQFYIVYFNDNTLYTYLYSLTAAPSALVTRIFSGETIEKIIAKFGQLFIITDSAVYMEDISNNAILSRVTPATGTATNYQIFRDGSGKIYAMPEGLSCLVDDSCNSSARLYFDAGCSAYNSCDAVNKLNDIDSYLHTVYKSFES